MNDERPIKMLLEKSETDTFQYIIKWPYSFNSDYFNNYIFSINFIFNNFNILK